NTRIKLWMAAAASAIIFISMIAFSTKSSSGQAANGNGPVRKDLAEANALQLVARGRQAFRFDTFGDETFWGDTLQLHRAIEGAQFGGVGSGVSPNEALAVGLKVDADALPANLIAALKQGKIDLDDPAVTLQLLKLDAVVGVKGFVNPDGSL